MCPRYVFTKYPYTFLQFRRNQKRYSLDQALTSEHVTEYLWLDKSQTLMFGIMFSVKRIYLILQLTVTLTMLAIQGNLPYFLGRTMFQK